MNSQWAVLERYNVICAPPPGTNPSGGKGKLLLSCANFVDQTKSASSKCSDKDMNCCMCRVDPNGEPNANQPTHLFLLP